MTTRIEKDGWIVSGDGLQELQIGIEAVQRALHMTVGIPPREAPAAAQKRGRPAASGNGKTEEARLAKATKLRGQVLAFLKAIFNSGEVGADGPSLVKATNVPHGKALGNVVGATNRFLGKHKIVPAKAYSVSRNAEGKRWKSGPMMSAAIAAAEAKEDD